MEDAVGDVTDHLIDVAPRLTPSEVRDSLSQAVSVDQHAVVLPDFFPTDVALELSKVFARLPWQQSFALFNEGTTRIVDETEFRSASEIERFSCSDIVRFTPEVFDQDGLPDIQRRNLERFLVWAVQGQGLRTWIGQALDIDLSGKVSFEFCRYREGGFLSSHADNFGGRLFGLCLYLDQKWVPADGGYLGHKDPNGRTTSLDPKFNSLSLIPIGNGHFHWVDRWFASRPGRHSFSLGLHPPVNQ